jgi:hypothetical protein
MLPSSPFCADVCAYACAGTCDAHANATAIAIDFNLNTVVLLVTQINQTTVKKRLPRL